MSNLPGFFLTIEGVEGAGKSTLASSLFRELAEDGREVIVTAEPGGGNVAEQLRRLLLNPASNMFDTTELLLFEAARAQHVHELIRPALERGAIVICDRFADSTTAYQGYARGVDLELVARLNEFATGGLEPDLTILLDLPAETGLARQQKSDRLGSEDLSFHEAVRRGYLAIAEEERHRFVILDAARNQEEALAAALEAARKALGS